MVPTRFSVEAKLDEAQRIGRFLSSSVCCEKSQEAGILVARSR
jgi:hypothetical protein